MTKDLSDEIRFPKYQYKAALFDSTDMHELAERGWRVLPGVTAKVLHWSGHMQVEGLHTQVLMELEVWDQ